MVFIWVEGLDFVTGRKAFRFLRLRFERAALLWFQIIIVTKILQLADTPISQNLPGS